MKRGRPKKYNDTLVTGGEGFIGSRYIASYGGDSFDKKSEQECLYIDDYGFRHGYKFVIHAAASMFGKYLFSDNVDATRVVVKQANKMGAKLVFISSAAVYGEWSGGAWREEDWMQTEPINLYGWSKYFGEQIVREEANDYCILRLSNVYGPNGQGVISKWIEQNSHLISEPDYIRDFVHVDDVVDAIELAKKLSGTYNISTGRGTSLMQVLEYLQLKRKITICGDQSGVLNREIKKSILDNSRILDKGFRPRSIWKGLDDFRDELGRRK